MTAPEPLISMQEVADRLGVPLQTLRRWRKHGRGPKGYPLGRRVNFRWSEVEAWLDQQHEDGPRVVTPIRGRRSA